MVAKYDVFLMVRVAQMFYLKDMDHGEIAEKLGMPEALVSTILAEVVKTGIVDIKIRQSIPAY